MSWLVPKLWVVVYRPTDGDVESRQVLVYALEGGDHRMIALVLGQWFLAQSRD